MKHICVWGDGHLVQKWKESIDKGNSASHPNLCYGSLQVIMLGVRGPGKGG